MRAHPSKREQRRAIATRGDTVPLVRAASVFAALGDPVRLQIVKRLCREGPLSISRLTEGAQISRQAVTKHLNALHAAGLAEDERNGRERIWQLRPARLEEVRGQLEAISAQWDQAIGRLKRMVETLD